MCILLREYIKLITQRNHDIKKQISWAPLKKEKRNVMKVI